MKNETVVNVPCKKLIRTRLQQIADARETSLAAVGRTAFLSLIEKEYPKLVKAGKIQEGT